MLGDRKDDEEEDDDGDGDMAPDGERAEGDEEDRKLVRSPKKSMPPPE